MWICSVQRYKLRIWKGYVWTPPLSFKGVTLYHSWNPKLGAVPLWISRYTCTFIMYVHHSCIIRAFWRNQGALQSSSHLYDLKDKIEFHYRNSERKVSNIWGLLWVRKTREMWECLNHSPSISIPPRSALCLLAFHPPERPPPPPLLLQADNQCPSTAGPTHAAPMPACIG